MYVCLSFVIDENIHFIAIKFEGFIVGTSGRICIGFWEEVSRVTGMYF